MSTDRSDFDVVGRQIYNMPKLWGPRCSDRQGGAPGGLLTCTEFFEKAITKPLCEVRRFGVQENFGEIYKYLHTKRGPGTPVCLSRPLRTFVCVCLLPV